MRARNRPPRKFQEQNYKEETIKNIDNDVRLNDNNKSSTHDDDDSSSTDRHWIVADDNDG